MKEKFIQRQKKQQPQEEEYVYTNKQHIDVLKTKKSERINFDIRRKSAENPSQIYTNKIEKNKKKRKSSTSRSGKATAKNAKKIEVVEGEDV